MDFRVSVIIPFYNASGFLSAAIASVIEQAEVGEIILVDDGSTDDSLQICHEMGKSENRIQVVTHPSGVNRGAGASRNLGIKAARLPFIAFLDADDIFVQNRFGLTSRTFLEHSDCDAVYEAVGTMHGGPVSNKPYLTTVSAGITPESLFFKISPVGTQGYFSIIGLTVKKSVFADIGFFSENLRVTQDTEWILRLTAKCFLYPGTIDKAVSLRRIHAGNRSTNEERMRKVKPEMAKVALKWFLQNEMATDKTDEVLRILLKYRFEELQALTGLARFRSKLVQIAECVRIKMQYPTLRKNPLLNYHLRLALHLPVRKHLNYYESPQ